MYSKKNLSVFAFVVIFCILLVFWMQHRNEKFSDKNREENFDVDVVYTWVDSRDEERDYYKTLFHLNDRETDGNLNPNRYVNNQELKYSLRSIEMYMPWVRYIFIVVKDGQKPNFVNFQNKKIRLVNHSEFIPKKFLPTFNSITIEHFLYLIPNLSERYIYFNDDMMVLQKLEKKDFFSLHGKPKINFYVDNSPRLWSFKNVYNHTQLRYYNNNLAKELFGVTFSLKQPHSPSPCFIPWDKEFDTFLQNHPSFHMTQFRDNKNLMKNNLLQTSFYFTKGAEPVQWKEIYIEMPETRNISPFWEIKLGDYMFLCVNGVQINYREQFAKLMSQLFPSKSSYET